MSLSVTSLPAVQPTTVRGLDLRLTTLVSRLLPALPSQLEPSTSLWALGLDSLSLITLFAELEDTFALTARDLRSVMHRSSTVGDISALVQRGAHG
jgi:acyl carrier protein